MACRLGHREPPGKKEPSVRRRLPWQRPILRVNVAGRLRVICPVKLP